MGSKEFMTKLLISVIIIIVLFLNIGKCKIISFYRTREALDYNYGLNELSLDSLTPSPKKHFDNFLSGFF